jgi:putative transposase
VPCLLWHAVDEHGAELDILDAKAARQGRRQTLLKACAEFEPVPRKLVTDQLRCYPSAKAEIPELANVKQVFVKAAARPNDRAENSRAVHTQLVAERAPKRGLKSDL